MLNVAKQSKHATPSVIAKGLIPDLNPGLITQGFCCKMWKRRQKSGCGNGNGCAIIDSMKRRIFFNGTTNVVRRPQDEGVSARERRMSTTTKGGSLVAMAALISGVAILGVNGQAQGLTYQTTINPEFTINPAISVSLSSADLIINDLEPGTTKDSNIITVTVSTNNSSGYTLGSTVGNSTTYDYDALKNNADNTKTFTNLTSAGSLTAGKWGYSYSNDNGTNWSTYNGLPLYTSTPVEIASSTTASTTNTQFKIGAYATTGQAAGEYNNVVNFIATASPEAIYTMQDFAAGTTSTTCSTMSVGDTITLADSRDNEEYLIGKLADNKCWMLDNLRLDPANSTTLNNITASNTHASATSINKFKNGGGTTSDQYPTAKINNVVWTSSSQNYYSIPMTINTYKDQTTTSYGAGSGKIGVYYNYCAASAGSYCYGNGTSAGTSSGNATEDLCPAGWRMPGGGSTINLTANPPTGEFKNLYNYYNTTQTATDTNSLQYNLSLPLSGYFSSGSAYSQGSYGRWWSSTRNNNSYMYYLNVNASSVNPAYYGSREYGYSLRCIAQ